MSNRMTQGSVLAMAVAIASASPVLTARGALPDSLDTSDADAVLHGEAIGDYGGRQVYGGGDVNGDGFDDLLVGAYLNDDGGSAAGKAYLILGDPVRLSGTQSLATVADASWIGEHAGDYASLELAIAPDIDGDGLDDLLIGAYHNSDGGLEAGKVYVVYGRSAGWNVDVSIGTADASFLGTDAGDHLARSVGGTDDIDGDGRGDWLVGGCWNSDAGYQAGKVYLMRGGDGPWSPDSSVESEAGASFVGEAPEDWAGRSVSGAGDVDGDGLADLLIGAYGNDDGGSGAGKAYLVLGRASGWQADADLGNYADAAFTGEAADDRAGLNLGSAGDVDGDGLDDFLIGAYRNAAAGSYAGAVYLVRGVPGAVYGGTVSLTSADAKYTGEVPGDYAGRSERGLGDLDGDGLDDLLIGASGSNAGGIDAGRAYVLLGVNNPADLSLAAADSVITAHQVSAEFGYMLGGAGDMDGAGHPEIVVPAHKGSLGGAGVGNVFVFYADDWFDDDGDGYAEDDGDCDDADAAVHPGAPEIPYDGIDQDCDGVDLLDADGDGYDSDAHGGDDCDDGDPAVHPGAPEVCNGLDDDCDPLTDEDADQDADGFSICEGDCDDAEPAVHPGAVEVCNGLDDDCDPGTDENVDGDGDGISICDGDCDDDHDTVYPGAPEQCDGVDNDCDGQVGPGEVDGDGDGILVCAGDCDDDDGMTWPGAPEQCDGVDNDCDGEIDEGVDEDLDGDGYNACQGDCDNLDPDTYPAAPEICDGQDNDCDGVLPLDEEDADGDGWMVCNGDCDDGDGALTPVDGDLDGYSTCDGDCDDENASLSPQDQDQDGHSTCDGDCDDQDAGIFPGATEIPYDGVDQDCDGADLTDVDGDGHDGGGGPDCDDDDPDVHPGAEEVPYDGVDNDCTDGDLTDVDGDGHDGGDGPDCDDEDPQIHPEAEEDCSDGVDNDCDGAVDDNDEDCGVTDDDDDDSDCDEPDDDSADDDSAGPDGDDGDGGDGGDCRCSGGGSAGGLPLTAAAVLMGWLVRSRRTSRRWALDSCQRPDPREGRGDPTPGCRPVHPPHTGRRRIR